MLSYLFVGFILVLFLYSLISRPIDVKHSFLNLFRQKRRTVTTLAAIVIGGASIFVFGGFFNFNFWVLREITIRNNLGHIQLYKKGYLESGMANPLKFGIPDYQHIEKTLRKDPEISRYIKAVVGQLSFAGIISNYEKGTSSPFIGLGIEPSNNIVLGFLDTIVLGSDLSHYDYEGAVIGKGLFQALGTEYDGYNDILIANKQGGQNAMSLRVRGAFQSGIKAYDDMALKIPLNTAQRLLDTKDVSKITVLLHDTQMTDLVADRIGKMIKEQRLDLEINTWPKEALYYGQVVTTFNGIFLFIKAVMAILVVFFIGNTLMMNVIERTREIGTIRALGVTKSHVWNLLFLEGFFMGLLGGVLSLACGWGISVLINIQGIPMPPAPGQTRGYIAFIRLEDNMDMVWFTLSLALITSFFASIIPAYKASRMVVVDALRHV